MRTHIASIFTMLLAGAAGCGAVDDGSCPTADQNDNVACTLDVCNAEGGGWAHIPNHDLCDPGQACHPTNGCVAGGSLAGLATLLGKTDHTGITVTVEGVEGATATTDAMGKWSIIIAPGTYRVTYSKTQYVSQTSGEIIVVAEASDPAPMVVLSHGEELGEERPITGGYSSFQNVDKSHLIEAISSPFGTAYYATPMDGSKEPVHITTNPNSIHFTATHAVWSEGNVIFSRPLTAATPPINLSSTITGGSISIIGTPGTYTVLRRARTLPQYSESSIYIARTDGMPAGAAVWTQPDATHPFSDFANDDAFGLLAVSNNSNPSGPPGDASAATPLYRVDLAAGTVTALNVGFATNQATYRSLSPDRSRVVGILRQYTGSAHYYRAFNAVLASGTPTLAPPSPGANPGYYQYADYPDYIDGWMPDGTFVFRSVYWYNGGAYYGGELRVWTPSGTMGTLAGTSGTYYNYAPVLLNGSVAWRDSGVLRVGSAVASPTVHVLDPSGVVNAVWSKAGSGTAGSYIAWSQVPAGTNLPNKIFGANIPATLGSAPPVVQLGPNIPATCSFEGTLSGTTYFALCSESGTLTSYAAASNTPAGMITGVHGSLFLIGTERIGFRKTDGSIYSTSNTGTFTDVKAIATNVDGNTPTIVAGDWFLFRDGTTYLSRVSRVDGSVIDEPLSDCDLATGSAWVNMSSSHLFVTSARCTNISWGMFRAPATNLP